MLHKKDKFGIQLYTICTIWRIHSSPFHFFCSLEFYVPSLTVAKSIRSPLGAAASRDGMTTNQRSRGGAAMFAYEIWKERNIHPQTRLRFVKCIKQCIKCIGEKSNRKYRSYQASIDPIPIPTLVSILSIFGSICPPLPQKTQNGSIGYTILINVRFVNKPFWFFSLKICHKSQWSYKYIA